MTNEQFMSSGLQDFCEGLLSMRRQRGWQPEYLSFYEYANKRWSISRKRAKLLCDYATLCLMCKEHHLKVPDSPENIEPLLELKAKKRSETPTLWLAVYQQVLDRVRASVTASSCEAAMASLNHFSRRKRLTSQQIKRIQAKRAIDSVARLGDGGALVDAIGPRGLGGNFESAMRTMIDADQARLDEQSEA